MDGPLDGEINEQIRAMMETDPTAAAAKIKKYLEETDNIQLNIAITGEPGTGKSTFVNAFRGINNNGEGAAPTGCENKTTNPTSYHHPDYTKVILWDLPANQFRENDVKLANEIQKMGKKFYFVCSKVNHNIRDEERSRVDFTEKKTLEKITEDRMKGLKELGIESPQVFLLRSPDVSLQGVKELKSTFEEELPELKRHALRLAMSNLNLQVLTKEKEIFLSNIKYYSVISAAGAVLPVPLLSAAVDLSLICFALRQYRVGFRLDTFPLGNLFAITKIPLFWKVLFQVTNTCAIASFKEDFSFMSRILALFFTTYVAVKMSVSELVEKLYGFFKRALGLNT
ncbi:interferon-inducible GTPase 5-like [Poeciliopsis prolifica]|uniref:interferon-inducible GTPase 5-like n=1 Tax=Poeciliopsis prolifica TaxID=188132 RepID=UPI00241325D6|nr:interferon-inducible GTPase 5-like [Poeciliopsis prolifica]